MKLDVDSLETFYEMAREGAGLAAHRLTPMTDIRTRVVVTRIHFTDRAAIADELAEDGDKIGIRVGLSGAISGESLILFDEDSAREVAEMLVTEVRGEDGPALSRSAIREVGGIVNNGFVDGWADVLDEEIDVSPPEFVADAGPGSIAGGGDGEFVVAFRSRIEGVGREIGFQHYLIPDPDDVSGLFAGRGGDRLIDSEKLAGFDRMTREGARTVAENLGMMTGLDADVEIRRIDFVSLDAIPGGVANERLVSVAFTFDGTPSGYLLFLFDRESAVSLVEAALGKAPDGDLGALERDAIQELSNIMASGFLDGWANVLDTTIDHSTPAYTYDLGAAVVDPLVIGLAERQEFAFVFDTRIRAVGDTFDLVVFAIPDEDDLIEALASLDADRVDDTPVTAEFAGSEADPTAFEVSDLTGADPS